MELVIAKKTDNDIVVSNIYSGCIGGFYDFDLSIKEFLLLHMPELENEILEDKKSTRCEFGYLEEEVEECYSVIDCIINKMGSVEEFLTCFDKLSIIIEDIDVLENIVEIIDGINIPIVLNLSVLPEDYVLDNIEKIDLLIKEKHKAKVSYLIKQCLGEAETNDEDNSYTAEEVITVLNFVKEKTDEVKNLNLSPLEQVMFIYDYVKDRYYNYSDDDTYLQSRDVAKVIIGDKIVCLGFATLFKSLLDNLGFDNHIIVLNEVNNESRGHARNRVIINDSKYNLNHILYFDATWDCKHSNSNIIDEDRYNYFGRTKLQFFLKEHSKLKVDEMYPFYLLKDDNNYGFIYKNIPYTLMEVRRMFNRINWEEYFINSDITVENLEKIIFLMTNELKGLVYLSQDYEFCLYIYKECCRMLNRKIPNDVFLRCLYTVRRVENNLYPDKYSSDKDKLLDIYCNWTMENVTDEKKHLFLDGFGFGNTLKAKLDGFEEVDLDDSRNMLLDVFKGLSSSVNNSNIDKSISVKEVVKILKK